MYVAELTYVRTIGTQGKDSLDFAEGKTKTTTLRNVGVSNATYDLIGKICQGTKYSSTISNIAISLGKSEQEIKVAVDGLVAANMLKKSIINNTIDFDILADNEINKLLDNIITSKIAYENESTLLSKFDTDRYVVSNKYNFEFSMTRYFYTMYLQSSEFKKLRSFEVLLKEAKADGIIINLIIDDNSTLEDVIDVLNKDNSEEIYRVIVRVNNKRISDDVFYKLKRTHAAITLLESGNSLSDTAKETLRVSIEDISGELNDYLRNYHLNSICLNKADFSVHALKKVVYNALIKSFPKTVVLNNEQVNKNIVSSVTIKARNNVIDNILGNTDIVYGPTSAEGTINASFDEAATKRNDIIVALQELIMNSTRKICASELVNYLSEFPFGMRKGIIPLFIAKVISTMNVFEKNNVQTVLLYNDSMQIKIDATNLTKLMNNPMRYYFSFKKINKERIHFVESVADILKLQVAHNFNEDAERVVKGLRSYVTNLEPAIVKSSLHDNVLKLSENEIRFKDLFLRPDLSAFDILCEGMNFLGVNSAEILGNIVIIRNAYKEKVAQLYSTSIAKVKEILSDLSEESIKTNYIKWKNDNLNITNIIFDDGNKKIYNAFESSQYNDYEVIDRLSFAALNCTLNDWNCRRQEQFFKAIESFIEFVQNHLQIETFAKDNIDVSLETNALSTLGTTLYTNLQEVLSEYGSSLTNSEKANILKKLLKDIID